MASDVIARVQAFATKAHELADKGHVLRAAEKFGHAAEAARALGADNLVTVYMLLRRSNLLGVYWWAATRSATADPCVLVAHRAEFIALLAGAVAVLEERRVADTLLEGKCTAAEEAWFTCDMPQVGYTAADAASMAPLVGYEQYLRAAKMAAEVLSGAHFFVAECSGAQFQSFAQHVVRAAELMQQPRRRSTMVMCMEPQFADALRYAVAEGGTNGLEAYLAQLLMGALQRLQHSGVLQAHRIEEYIGSVIQENEADAARLQTMLTAPGLRRCALDGCGAKEAHPAHFKSCAACRAVVYCCREHQVEAWPAHKKACKAARKAAAAADGAGPSGA